MLDVQLLNYRYGSFNQASMVLPRFDRANPDQVEQHAVVSQIQQGRRFPIIDGTDAAGSPPHGGGGQVSLLARRPASIMA